MTRTGRAALLAALLLPAPLAAQGWRVLLDSRVQATSYRGWRIDSIPVADTVTGAGGGTETPDGYVARCNGAPFCRYWHPGAEQRGAPALLTADATLWGLGLAGLSFHARTRFGADLGASDPWYGPDRTVELVEGYADLDRERYELRAGRQVVSGRIGWWGIDGVRGWLRDMRHGLEASAYAGWGLARSSNLTVTSDALNPLGDFQTGERQVAWGAIARWSEPHGSIEAQYHREWSGVDGGVTVERGALSAEHVIRGPLSASGGAIYDVASGLWGSWDLGARFAAGPVSASARIRQYRPLFDLWSVWQVFSPVAYHAAEAGVGVRVDRRVAFRITGERYWYGAPETSTPLVSVEDAGWRMSFGATWDPRPALTVNGELRREFGVGAYANSVQGSVVWLPRQRWTLRANAGHLERPLEYRYDVSTLDWLGLGADWRASDRVTLGGAVDRWSEARDRPDAAAFSWDQFRLSFRMSWLLVSDADRVPLPPGRPRSAR